MSVTTGRGAVAVPPRQGGPHPVPGRGSAPGRRRWPVVPVALAGAWLVPLGAQALGLDAVLPPLLLLAVAALLRSGRSLLDRLVLALALLLGAACVAGLLLSVWPWHLAPVPVAGTAFTVLVLVAVVLRRRPSLPRRVRAADLVVLGFTGLAGASVLWPFHGQDAGGRLGVVAAGGDLANHFSLMDAVRTTGGYVFLHPHAQGARLIWAGLRTYPQGTHMIGALLANFLDSSAGTPSTLHEINMFVWFEPATFILMCLCVLWACRRVAGPGVRALALLPVAALGTAYLIWADPLMVMWTGFWSELLGFAEFALLAGVLVRPVHRRREQATVVAALLAALCFTYYLLAPVAVVLIGGWLLWYRRRLRGARRFTSIVLVAALLSGGVMVAVNLADTGLGARVLSYGSSYPINRRMLATFVLLALAGIVLTARRRSVSWRMSALLLTGAVGLFVAVAGYQVYRTGGLLYYSYKTMHLIMIVSVIGLGPLARLLPRHRLPRPTALVLTLAALVSLGPLGLASPGRSYLNRSLARDWIGRAALEVVRGVPEEPGTITIVWGGRPQGWAAQTSHWTNAMWRNLWVSWQGHMWVATEPRTGVIPEDDLLTFLAETAPRRVRFVTDSPDLLAVLGAVRLERPDLGLSIVDLNLPK